MYSILLQMRQMSCISTHLGEVLRAAGFDTHSGENSAGENLDYFLNNIKGEE